MNEPAADSLDGDGLVRVMRAFSDALRRHEDLLNRLNVFPVEDGDTGKNMADTVESAIARLGPTGTPMAAVCSSIAEHSLMGAKGNSGVILCQMLRAMTGVLALSERADSGAIARAFVEADAAARAAVMDPKEGTILSVAEAAARAASAAVDKGLDLASTLEATRDEAVVALAETPHLLPVLRDAGVVDSGGAGLVLLYEAFLHVAGARPMPADLPLPAAVAAAVAAGLPRRPTGSATYAPQNERAAGAGATGADAPHPRAGEPASGSLAELRYEVMYLLSAPDDAMPAFKDVWAGIGDSIVVVGGGGLWNCHIHTNDIGAAIEAALDIGKPRQIRVTDLLEQVEEERWVRAASAADATQLAVVAGAGVGGVAAGAAAVARLTGPAGTDAAVPRTSVVAVVPGEGIGRIFHSMRAPHFVLGGPSMNPSTREILAVVEAAPGDEVVILPNNPNCLLVAEQVQAVSGKKVRVVPTRAGIQEGLSAVVPYDPEAGAEENAAAMEAAAAAVAAGEVTRAVRAGRYGDGGGSFEAGDWIGLARSGVVSAGSSAGDAACGLLEAISGDANEIVAVIAGEGASAADTRRISEWLNEHRPGLVVETHQGGQPLYAYLISVE